MKNIFSFGTYSFESSYLQHIQKINTHDFAYTLSDIHLIAPYIKFDIPDASSYGSNATYISKTKQIYKDLENKLTQLCKEASPVENIILLCMDMCSPYKYPLAYLNENFKPSASFSLLNIFENPLFTEDVQYMLQLSWIYNISTKNSPTSLASIIDHFGGCTNKKATRKFANCFYKTKSDFVSSYSALLYSYYEKKPKSAVKPLCIYDLLSTQENMLYKTDPEIRQLNLQIDSKYDLAIIFGMLNNRMKNDPLFHIYSNDERIKRFKNSFDIKAYLDKFFLIKNLSNENERIYKSLFDNYFIEKFTNVNFSNCFFDPSLFRENMPFTFEPLFLLSLHPLINFRIALLKKMLTLPQNTFDIHLNSVLNTIFHQTFFYFPLLQILFHLCMLIIKDQLDFSPNKKLIFPKTNSNYYSYLNNFTFSNAMLFKKDENSSIIPVVPFPDFSKDIEFTSNGEKHSISQKTLHTSVNHAVFKLLHSTLFQIQDMNFIDVACDYHHTKNTFSFTDSVIADFNLNEISNLISYLRTPEPIY